VKVTPVSKARWKSICTDCSGAIDSLVELLQGRLSQGVMERICRQNTGLFPSPKEIKLSCSCPDWADMCKHVAAVLYGIGARLDRQPELLFRLHEVNHEELIAGVSTALPLAKEGPARSKVLGSDDLAGMFGLDMAPGIGEISKTRKAPAAKKVTVSGKPRKSGSSSKRSTPATKAASRPRRSS
jgi:uncharacterized Zn finger protein